MARMAKWFVFFPALLLIFSLQVFSNTQADHPAAAKEVILKANDITTKIFPDKVFFRGQVATVQMRNAGGVHFADDLYVLAGLVDISGLFAFRSDSGNCGANAKTWLLWFRIY
jgi:hypothetical protein